MIAVTHPGKIGDMLYSLPTAKELSKKHNCKIDFYTSSYCSPAICLLEKQNYINKVIIPSSYVIERYDMGVQPYLMPIEDSYDTVYQLGFRDVPDKSIPEFIAESIGLSGDIGKNISYEYSTQYAESNYICLAPRGSTGYTELFLKYIDLSPLPVFIVGDRNQYIGKGVDYTFLDFEQMTSIIANAKAFIGLMSAPLVIANGFNIPKFIIHDGHSWDMRHVIYNEYTNYVVNPEADYLNSIVQSKIII